jgi:hypothetical protein
MTHRGKVLTLFTLFKINNLSVYIDVNANKKPQMGTRLRQGFGGQAVPARPVAKRLKF